MRSGRTYAAPGIGVACRLNTSWKSLGCQAYSVSYAYQSLTYERRSEKFTGSFSHRSDTGILCHSPTVVSGDKTYKSSILTSCACRDYFPDKTPHVVQHGLARHMSAPLERGNVATAATIVGHAGLQPHSTAPQGMQQAPARLLVDRNRQNNVSASQMPKSQQITASDAAYVKALLQSRLGGHL